MKVGLFGGTFNPPHIAHLIVAEAIRDQYDLDQVWWIPNHVSPHKVGFEGTPPEHRLAMVRLAIAEHPDFELCDLEIRRARVSYTVDTLRILQAQYPSLDFYFIIGGDSLATFDRWHATEEILERVPLIVYPRPGAPIEVPDLPDNLGARIFLATAPLLNLSSTIIREQVGQGHSIRYIVPDAVRTYIEVHRLYI